MVMRENKRVLVGEWAFPRVMVVVVVQEASNLPKLEPERSLTIYTPSLELPTHLPG